MVILGVDPGYATTGFGLIRAERGTYALLRIPCGVWYGFTALGGKPAIICNAADIPHDPNEGKKCPYDAPESGFIPFDWNQDFPS